MRTRMKIKDKIAMVTGASSGIGRALAKLFSEKGAKVALVARSKEKLEALSKELPHSFAIPADMTVKADIERAVRKLTDRFGGIDILVNNAGRGYDAPVEKIDADKFRRIFELNVLGPITAMQLVIPVMRIRGGGMIVNVSSGTALMYLPNMSPYSSSKRALAGITLTAREELKKDNIRVSVVYPFITDTDFEKNTIKEFIDEEDAESGERLRADTPEYIAGKICKGIEKEEAEIFAHDWMKDISGRVD
jgi:short-subunit dehydrogenase